MIQRVVTGLETNSFSPKALAMTLATTVIAFSGLVKNPNWVFPLVGCLPVLVFWIMDSTYLRLGGYLDISTTRLEKEKSKYHSAWISNRIFL